MKYTTEQIESVLHYMEDKQAMADIIEGLLTQRAELLEALHKVMALQEVVFENDADEIDAIHDICSQAITNTEATK
jgi:hypothetical protein